MDHLLRDLKPSCYFRLSVEESETGSKPKEISVYNVGLSGTSLFCRCTTFPSHPWTPYRVSHKKDRDKGGEGRSDGGPTFFEGLVSYFVRLVVGVTDAGGRGSRLPCEDP